MRTSQVLGCNDLETPARSSRRTQVGKCKDLETSCRTLGSAEPTSKWAPQFCDGTFPCARPEDGLTRSVSSWEIGICVNPCVRHICTAMYVSPASMFKTCHYTHPAPVRHGRWEKGVSTHGCAARCTLVQPIHTGVWALFYIGSRRFVSPGQHTGALCLLRLQHTGAGSGFAHTGAKSCGHTGQHTGAESR